MVRMNRRTPIPVLIDCDPGIDDTIALMYLAALHHAGEAQIVGVTTTAGNVGVEDTAANAAWVLAKCGIENVPIAAGCAGPEHVELTITPETHGPTGLGYVSADSWGGDDDWHAIWARAYRENPETHLIVTGPMTNVDAYERANGAVPGPITVMGGAVNYRGNTTPTAEWNFWVDPHAAATSFSRRRALSDGLPESAGVAEPAGHAATLCSLGVTEQMLLTPIRLKTLVATLGDCPLAAHLPEILRFYFEFHEAQGEGYQAQIHDLLTVMIALRTIGFDAVATTVAVESESELLRGTSVADVRRHWGELSNANLVTGADIEGAHAELLRAAEVLARKF